MGGEAAGRQRTADARAGAAAGMGLDRIDALMVLLVLIWGTAFPVITLLSQKLDPFQLTWYRYLPFPILYGTYILLRRRGVLGTVSGPDWVTMGAIGCLGVVGYHFTLNWAMADAGGAAINGATGALLVATTPIWTLILSVLLGREPLRALAAVGTVLAFAGVAVVVLKGQGETEVVLAAKALVALGAPVSWAMYAVFSKPLITRYGGAFVTGATLSIGTLSLLPLGLSYGVEPLTHLTAGEWGWLAFLALLSTALGYAIWNHAIRHRTASSVTAYIYLNPVVATIAGAWVLPALSAAFVPIPVTPWFLLGGALVLGGILLIHRARVQAMQKPETPAEGEGLRP